MRERPVSRWLDRTNVLVGIAVGVITVLGGIVALVTRGGASPAAVDQYRTKLQAEICLGDLAAASSSSVWDRYADGPDGQIDKAAWLSAMDTTRSHFVAARDRLQQLSPPASLRDEWTGSTDGLDDLIKFWDDFKANTQTLSPSELTVFTYPSPSWQARLTATEASLDARLGRLMGRSCQPGPSPPS